MDDEYGGQEFSRAPKGVSIPYLDAEMLLKTKQTYRLKDRKDREVLQRLLSLWKDY